MPRPICNRGTVSICARHGIAKSFSNCAQRRFAPILAQNSTIKNLVNTDNSNEVAVIKTSHGEMVLEFWPDVAPKTVENFKKLARDGFYDGTAFHRVVKNFMIQGGDPLTKSAADEHAWGTGGPGYKVKAEFNDRSHVRGVISMARSQNPDSAGSQFFICLAEAKFLDRQYTAFGKLIKGDDVLGKIGDTTTAQSGGGEKSKPTVRQGVESVKIVSSGEIQ